ncbi:hypothetical protein LUZ60_007370 [Juncus effusus]|nr:hypothetical protein LUZ60_007370 [Juncus effusus]
MKTNNIFYLNFTLLLLILSSHVSSSDLNQTCKKPLNLTEACKYAIDHVPFIVLDHCTSLLKSDKRVRSVTDLHGLALHVTRLALNRAVNAESKIEELMDLEGSPSLKKSFHTCFEVYSDAVDQLRDALDNMKEMVYGSVVDQLKKAVGAPESCEKALKGMHKVVKSLSTVDQEYERLAAVALGLAKSVE